MNKKESKNIDNLSYSNSSNSSKNPQSEILDRGFIFGQKVDIYILAVKIDGETKKGNHINFSTKSIRYNSIRRVVEAFQYIVFKAKEQHLRPECLSFKVVCAGVSEYLGMPKIRYSSINSKTSIGDKKYCYPVLVYYVTKAVYILIHETYQLSLDAGSIPVKSNPTNRK